MSIEMIINSNNEPRVEEKRNHHEYQMGYLGWNDYPDDDSSSNASDSDDDAKPKTNNQAQPEANGNPVLTQIILLTWFEVI